MSALVEVNAEAVAGVQRDLDATAAALLHDLQPLRAHARALGVPVHGFDRALEVQRALRDDVAPVVALTLQRARALADLHHDGRLGATFTAFDHVATGYGAAGHDAGGGGATEPAVQRTHDATGTNLVFSWASTGADDEAADDDDEASSRGLAAWLGDWAGDRVDDVTGAAEAAVQAFTDARRWAERWDLPTRPDPMTLPLDLTVGVFTGAAWWDWTTDQLGAAIDSHAAGVREFLGEHVWGLRKLSELFTSTGWVVTAYGAMTLLDGGAGLPLLAIGGALLTGGGLTNSLADWADGKITGKELVQRATTELIESISLRGSGKAIAGVLKHLPKQYRDQVEQALFVLLVFADGADLPGDLIDPIEDYFDEEWVEYGRPRFGHAEDFNDKAPMPTELGTGIADLGGTLDPEHVWGVDPVTGLPLSRQEYFERYTQRDGFSAYPPNGGAVPGTEKTFTDIGDYIAEHGRDVDRIGFESGGFLATGKQPPWTFDQRALPVPSLGLDYHQYTLTGTMPAGVTIEVGTVAPAFGHGGGGVQLLFIDPVKEREMTIDELKRAGVLTDRKDGQ